MTPAAVPWAGEVLRAGLLALGFALVLAVIELWHRRAHPPVEWTRKALHVLFGLSATTLPWVLRSHWTVLALALVIALPLAWARRRGLLPSLFGVERHSYGEMYFPAGVYVLFLVSSGHRVFYVVSLITLVICDALAALLGKSYGRHHYLVHRDQRSLEGSAVFLFTAFLGTHLPLLLLTDMDRGACVVISVQLALIVTAFEAIATGGSDNFLLPLATYYLLVKLTPHTASEIGYQLAAQLGILLATLAFARRTGYLSFSGAVAAHLALYAAFSLGAPAWVVAPAVALLALVALDRIGHRRLSVASSRHDVQAIFYVAIVATLWLFADNSFATLVRGAGPLRTGHPFRALFVDTLAASLSVIAYWTFESMPRLRRRSRFNRAALAISVGCGIVALPGFWAVRGQWLGMELAGAALLCTVALALHLLLRRRIRPVAGSLGALQLLAVSVLLASLVLLPLQLWSQGYISPRATP